MKLSKEAEYNLKVIVWVISIIGFSLLLYNQYLNYKFESTIIESNKADKRAKIMSDLQRKEIEKNLINDGWIRKDNCK